MDHSNNEFHPSLRHSVVPFDKGKGKTKRKPGRPRGGSAIPGYTHPVEFYSDLCPFVGGFSMQHVESGNVFFKLSMLERLTKKSPIIDNLESFGWYKEEKFYDMISEFMNVTVEIEEDYQEYHMYGKEQEALAQREHELMSELHIIRKNRAQMNDPDYRRKAFERRPQRKQLFKKRKRAEIVQSESDADDEIIKSELAQLPEIPDEWLLWEGRRDRSAEKRRLSAEIQVRNIQPSINTPPP